MAHYYITSENTEDTFDSADNLQDAIRIARAVAQEEQAGETINVEHEGKVIRQFVLMANGKLAEESLAR